MKRAIAVAAVLAALLALAPAAGAVTFQNGYGLTVTSVKQLDARLIALTVKTPAIPGPTLNVRILLPTGYAQHPHERYPVLYLLHGTSGTASDWTVKGNAEPATAGKPLIVVMPDIAINDGGGGWCTNWPDGTQNWETFHIDQLVPWVQQNLRTLNSRGERAIAGLSQGGFCSMSYAAQFPNLFGVVLAYSGVPDMAENSTARAGALAIINATEVGLDGVPPDSMFGNPVTNYLNYADHDPATLVQNLRYTKMYFYFGNGLPGPYDTTPDPAGEAIEAAVYQDNIDFHELLQQVGIAPAVYDPYGNGTHSWPYWDRDLTWSIGDVMNDFAHPVTVPKSFSYMSASPEYSMFGWIVSVHRLAAEFSTLQTTGVKGFTLQGSGSATVLTPASFDRAATYLVTIQAQNGTTIERLHPTASHRLQIAVPLGPSDTTQEYSQGGPPAPSPGTTVYTTHVTIQRRHS
jgi:S-formylglutathione hydrolase FrmB